MAAISYATLSLNFARVKDLPPSQVGSVIGGKVEANIKANIFQNACAIRLSYAFNYSGLPISQYDGKVSSGRDKKWYLYRVEDMKNFIKKHIGGTPIKGQPQRISEERKASLYLLIVIGIMLPDTLIYLTEKR